MLLSLDDILHKAVAKKKCKRIVIAAAEDIYVLEAVNNLFKLGLVAPIFIGNGTKIRNLIDQANLALPNNFIISANSPEESAEKAVELINNHEADILIKGLVSTRIMLKTVIKKMRGTPGTRFLSHLALFESPNVKKVFGLTDAAINIAPDIQTKIQIIHNAVNAFHKLGYRKPNVALLAAIEKVNYKMQSTVDAKQIRERHNERNICHCELDGPLALDIALSKQAADHKNYQSSVAGNADILVVPEINSGNIFYKSLTYLGGARTAGVVLGTPKPIVISSRTDSPESKLFSVALGINLC